jgi:hypothetical protein
MSAMFNSLLYVVRHVAHSCQVRKFLKEPISFEECKALLVKGMSQREENFLFVLKELIYGYPGKNAHMTYNDVAKMAKRHGIEGTLDILRQDGVYVTYEEFKGHRDVERKGKTFRFRQRDFSNPDRKMTGEVYRGSSRGRETMMRVGEGYLMQKMIHEAIMLDMHGCVGKPMAIWYPAFPCHTALYPIRLKKMGLPFFWFSQTAWPRPEFWRQRVSAFLNSMYLNYKMFEGIPFKEVGSQDAGVIAEWAAEQIKSAAFCSIHTFVTAAVRVCLAARERGLNIRNTTFIVTGEPLTRRRRMEIEASGCRVVPAYYFSEGGLAGCGCADLKNEIDAVHFFKDSMAVLQYDRFLQDTDKKVNAFLFTSLYRGCPIVMLNLENGDYGEMKDRACDCAWGQLGLTQYLTNIGSHEKLTAEGVTYDIGDAVHIIQEIFPEVFGGSSIDYQLVEEEDARGIMQLALYISPRVSIVDEKKLKQLLFEKISINAGRDTRIRMWNQIDILKIIRKEPWATLRGKTLPFRRSSWD